MPKLKLVVAGALLAAGCSGKAELGGDAAPGKQPSSPLSAPTTRTASNAAPHRHLMLVVELQLDAHQAITLDSHFVDLPLPTRRVPVAGAWRVEVLASDGALLYSAELPDASLLRGEFPGKDGQLEAVPARKSKAALTLRLPILPDASTVRVLDISTAGGAAAPVELGRVSYPKAAP